MKNIIPTAIVSVFTVVPSVSLAGGFASGEGTNNDLATFIASVVSFMNDILIPAILALAFLVFVWGVFLYFVKGGADDEAQSKGKQLMLYAIGGFVLILIFFGIVNLLVNSIGTDNAAPSPTEIPGIEVGAGASASTPSPRGGR